MAAAHPELAPIHPAVHLAPPVGWMNDPNGLSLVDGVWHAYYQHNPHDDVWGPMHWRHATSPDLIGWTDHGIVLAPGDLGDIFSGSVVVDADDTAGFGAGARVAVFTLALGGVQRQGLAWSTDGHRWTVHDGNPVLADPDEADFRDPKVIRHGDHWVMVLAMGPQIGLYRSPDLKRWEELSRYRPSTPVVGQIECPDLFPITTRSGEPAWVMMYGEDRGGPDDHGGTLAAAGHFDGTAFTEWAPPALVDHGPDFYAAQTFSGLADGQDPVVLAWMNSWHYSRVHPSRGRRGVLSMPRMLWVTSESDPRVRSHLAPHVVASAEPVAGSSWASVVDRAVVARGAEFRLVVSATPASPVANKAGGGPSLADGAVEVVVGGGMARLVRPDGGLDLDRFAIDLEVPTGDGPVTVVIDHGTVEVLTGAGQAVSALVFLGADWAVTVEGDATLASLGSGSGGSAGC